MIVSWNWLSDYVRLDVPVETLVERLMMTGLNHESTSDVEGDIAIDLEVTSNRPDCLGHLGIAREVAAVLEKELKLPSIDYPEDGPRTSELTSVTYEAGAEAWAPRYRARVIQGVKIGPSPDWMQRRLRALGLTPINNVVDITNYVLMETGQPLHAFDYDKLVEKRIVVRAAKAKEPFRAINNRDYELAAGMGVIADAKRPVAIAGVMGGADTEVGPHTTNILLEAAEFAPLSIRKTSRALDLSSDSSYRFERKIDPAGVAWSSDRALHLIHKLAGGKIAKGFVEVGAPPESRPPIRLRWNRVARVLGIDAPPPVATKILGSLGFPLFARDDESGLFTPPSFRRDITREIDLIEEVGRLVGYESVPEDAPLPLAVAQRRKSDEITAAVRDLLCAFGYHEAVTFTFTDAKTLATVRPWTSGDALTVRHSSRKQENCLRQSLIPSLLESLARNLSRGVRDARLFEVAHIYLPAPDQLLPIEPAVVGMATTEGIRAVRGEVETIASRLRVPLVFRPAEVVGLAPGQAAEYLLDGERVGVLGKVAPRAAEHFDLRADAVVAELRLGPIIDAARKLTKVAPIPEHPAVERDFAFVLDETTPWAELEQASRHAAGPCLESIEFIDLYRGAPVPAGKKSIAYRLTYRAPGRTLTREEVDGYQQAVHDAVASRLGGQIRT